MSRSGGLRVCAALLRHGALPLIARDDKSVRIREHHRGDRRPIHRGESPSVLPLQANRMAVHQVLVRLGPPVPEMLRNRVRSLRSCVYILRACYKKATVSHTPLSISDDPHGPAHLAQPPAHGASEADRRPRTHVSLVGEVR